MTRHLLTVMLSLTIAGCGLAPAAPHVGAQQAGGPRASAQLGLDAYLDQVFEVADLDRDGRLSLAESGLLREQVAVLDRNGDEAIDRKEWQAKASMGQILKGLPAFLPMVLNLHTTLDADRNRLVSLGEVRQAVSGTPIAALSADALADSFMASDADRDGGLNGAEFQDFYMDLGAVSTQAGPLLQRGIVRRAAMAMLGTYVAVMGQVTAPKAIHPKRNPITLTPSRHGYAYEDVSFKTEDGLAIKGWYVPAKVATQKTLVMVHGISDNRSWLIRMNLLPMVHEAYNVLAIDLRNHGESEGSVTSFGYHEAKDVVAAVQYLSGRGIDSVALYGVSLGGASVIRAAALLPQVKGVIDDCAFATVSQAFAGFMSLSLVPSPVLVASAALVRANRLLGIDMTTTEPVTQVGRIAPRPFLVIHGAEDKNVPVDNSRTNFLAAGEGLKKELWIVPAGEHAASALAQPDAYRARLQGFLQQVAW